MKNLMLLIISLIFSNATIAHTSSHTVRPTRIVYVPQKENKIIPFLVFGTAFGVILVMQKIGDDEDAMIAKKTWRF